MHLEGLISTNDDAVLMVLYKHAPEVKVYNASIRENVIVVKEFF